MTKKHLWQKPRLRDDEERRQERRASWLELFYDLVFVAVVAVVADSLAHEKDLTAQAVLNFGLLFIPMWWVWVGSTFYNERFETDDVSQRLFTFLKMGPLVGMAYSAHHAFEDLAPVFAASYAAARIILIAMWVRAGLHVPAAKPLVTRYAVGFSASALLWLVSIVVPSPARFVLWGLGLLLDLLTPLTTMGVEAKLPRLSTSRLPERFGALVIIVLGESLVGVIQGVTGSTAPGPGVVALAALALVLCCSLWWIYFDHVMSRPARPNIWWSLVWVYTHLVLAMGLTAYSAAVRNAIAQEGGLSPSVRWLLCGSLATALGALGVLELTLRHPSGTPAFVRRMALLRGAAAATALLLAWLGGEAAPWLLFTCLAAVALTQVLYGLYAQAQGHFHGHHHTAEGADG